MNTAKTKLATATLALLAGTQVYAMDMSGPPMGGSMLMPNVSIVGNSIVIDAPPPGTPVLAPHPEYTPMGMYAPLAGKAYNRQYGWNMDAINYDVPAGLSIWIELQSATPGLETYDHTTYAPIFATAGSPMIWEWNGNMAHNAYAVAPGVGLYSATYRLYLGDANGVAEVGYSDAQITLNWTSVPEPASLAAVGSAGVVTLRRRRR